MKIFKNKSSLLDEIKNAKNLSFVPTMGGFHAGHKSLIVNAKKKTKKVIVTIYVNPKQFNSKKDFKTYPRDISSDISMLKKLKVDYLYLPKYSDLFSFKVKNKIYLDKFHKELCGKHRPNHFNGVVNVVNRFLEIINPKYIFLGKKDFQQLYLIKKHIQKHSINTKVVSCKTIREINGLPCSTRNKNLNKNQALIASKTINFLRKEKYKIKKNKKIIFPLNKILVKMKKIGVCKIDYIKLLNNKTLKFPNNSKVKFHLFTAFYIKNIRLIDNF